MSLTIGIPREIFAGEKRVAAVPEVVEKLVKLGFRVCIESGAGSAANFDDASYVTAGARVAVDARELYVAADLLLKVRAPTVDEVSLIRRGSTLVSFVWPAQNPGLMQQLAERQLTALAMDSVPRISRAQKMDALSSMANIAGYRAVIEAAHHFSRSFTGQITAAGKIAPAKVFVIGAGVAGLAALGTAVSLGAVVRANDTRPEVADQIKSMGAEFVPVDHVEDGAGVGGYAKVMSEAFQKAQLATFAKQAREVDVIITTALIPGKAAPKLLTADMVKSMRAGSVIVDLAAEQGGNCELTVPGEVVVRHGVTIIGYTDLPSRLAKQASTLYSTNVLRLIEELCKTKDGSIDIDFEDEVVRGATVVRNGEITWPPPAPRLSAAPAPSKPEAKSVAAPTTTAKKGTGHGAGQPVAATTLAMICGIGAVLFWVVGTFAPASFLSHFTVFVLACFVGYMVVWNVTPSLHTPLMSVTNAISSIIAIGALVQVAPPLVAGMKLRIDGPILALAALALLLTAINMIGGFAVTHRMLAMFRK
jgi:NAD(P) transhydrogenase subunit alpha